MAQEYEDTDAGAFHELTGLRQGRVVVIAPTPERCDAICGLLRSLMERTVVLERAFWIAHKSVLEGANLNAPVWARPDAEGLHPLVPSNML